MVRAQIGGDAEPVMGALLAAFALLLAGCQSCREIGGGAGLDLPFLDVVYECAAIDGTGRVVELCYDGGATELGRQLADEPGGMWTCEPTSRHLGPCWYHCDAGRGCNAFDGCYCPEGR